MVHQSCVRITWNSKGNSASHYKRGQYYNTNLIIFFMCHLSITDDTAKDALRRSEYGLGSFSFMKANYSFDAITVTEYNTVYIDIL